METNQNHEKPWKPTRVAGLGRLSAGAKMAMKPFVKRVFTIFATNASFLRAIANLQIYHVISWYHEATTSLCQSGRVYAHKAYLST